MWHPPLGGYAVRVGVDVEGVAADEAAERDAAVLRQIDRQARIWLVTFMHYDLGYFDDETYRLEPIDNPVGPKLLPMSPD